MTAPLLADNPKPGLLPAGFGDMTCVAAPPGFEPGLSAPKADVLPLHHGATKPHPHCAPAPCPSSRVSPPPRRISNTRRCRIAGPLDHLAPKSSPGRNRIYSRAPTPAASGGIPQGNRRRRRNDGRCHRRTGILAVGIARIPSAMDAGSCGTAAFLCQWSGWPIDTALRFCQ